MHYDGNQSKESLENWFLPHETIISCDVWYDKKSLYKTNLNKIKNLFPFISFTEHNIQKFNPNGDGGIIYINPKQLKNTINLYGSDSIETHPQIDTLHPFNMLNELVNTGIKETPVEIVIVYSNKWIIKKNFSFDGDSNLLESVDKFIKGMVEGAKDLEKLGKTPEQYKDVLYDEYKTKLETYIPIVKDYINKTESINNDHILEQEVSQFDLYEEEKNQNNETGQQISGDVENHDTF